MRAIPARTTLGFALLLLQAGAAAGIEFTSSFESIRMQARPGRSVTRTFQLHLAPEGERVHFRSRVEDWWQSEDGSQSFYREPGTLARSCGPWVSLNPVETAVNPGGTLEIRVTAAVPPDAATGGYWCVLTVDELPDPLHVPAGVEVRFLASVSVGIFVEIEPVTRSLEITDVDVSSGRARIRVRNTGDGPVGVDGRIEIFRPGGSEAVASVAVPRATVLPEPVPTRVLSADLPDAHALPDGRYRAVVLLDIGLDHYLGVQRELEIRREPARGR
jgi:hypothetical protein